MSFLDDYEPVEDRLAKFWADHPDGQINTEMLSSAEGEFIVKAMVWRQKIGHPGGTPGEWVTIKHLPDATGLAHEVVGQSGVNKTSALENCETSAIGRALANLGYAAKGKRPSREEMSKTVEDPGAWLAEQVATLTDWPEATRREHYTLAMNYLSYDKLDSMEKAQHVFNHMKATYEEKSANESAPE